MIYSMTAFSRVHLQEAWGQMTWEIRTVNHRYLDIFIRLPDLFREWEPKVREQINASLQRGKVDCQLRFSPGKGWQQALQVNTTLADQLIQACTDIATRMQTPAPLKATDILHWPDVLQTDRVDIAPVKPDFFKSLQSCLDNVTSMRAREGQALVLAIEQRLEAIEKEIEALLPQLPIFIEKLREKLTQRLAEIDVQADPTRLEQEMVLLAQKADVSEEIDRLQTHVGEVKRLLKKGGVLGRKLDFLMQELNREANTLASKATDLQITRVAVELKVLIEQMREQIQNIA